MSEKRLKCLCEFSDMSEDFVPPPIQCDYHAKLFDRIAELESQVAKLSTPPALPAEVAEMVRELRDLAMVDMVETERLAKAMGGAADLIEKLAARVEGE